MSNDLWGPSPEAQEAAAADKRAAEQSAAPANAPVTPQKKPRVPESPSTAQRRPSLAVGGRIADPDKIPQASFPGYSATQLQYEVEALADDADLRKLMHNILIARQRLYYVTKMLSDAQRRAVEAKYDWKSALNRKILSVSGGTEKDRVALAEVSVEKEYSAYLAAEQEAEDALNLLRAIRTDLDSLQNLSYNIRAQMQMM